MDYEWKSSSGGSSSRQAQQQQVQQLACSAVLVLCRAQGRRQAGLKRKRVRPRSAASPII